MKNKAKRNVFILSLCVVAAIPFAGKNTTFEATPVDKKEASVKSVLLSEILVDEEEKVLESYLSKCDNLISFVESNFATFVREYNASIENTADGLKASYVEYTNYTYIVEDKTYGVYFDFDEDNGYTLISKDYVIYELETCCDLVELRDYDSLFYSRADGFEYLDEDGTLQCIINKDPDAYCYTENADDAIYPGQKEAGDGEIESASIGDYVKERYPDSEYETKNEKLASSFDCEVMHNTSYYERQICDENGNDLEGRYTEGNCGLNSTYNVIRSWGKCSLIKGVDYTSTTDVYKTIKSDPLYQEYGTKIIRSVEVDEDEAKTYSSKGTVTQYYYWEPNYQYRLEVMPTLYTNIRAYAIDKYDYTPESGIKAAKIPNIIEKVLSNYYGVKVSVSYKSNVSKAIEAIDEGHAVHLSIAGSSTYKNHGVVLIGYQKYTYEGGWWVFSSTKDAYFYQIADGWHNEPMYFDPNTNASPSLHFSILD